MVAEEFIKQFLPVAKQVEKETGISALAMLAQSALETGWGTLVKGNSYFGIKGKDVLFRTKEKSDKPNLKFPEIISITPYKDEITGKQMYLYDVKTWFKSYSNPIDSFIGYAKFIHENKRYSEALKVKDNPELYLEAVALAGYAGKDNRFKYRDELLKVLQSVKKRL